MHCRTTNWNLLHSGATACDNELGKRCNCSTFRGYRLRPCTAYGRISLVAVRSERIRHSDDLGATYGACNTQITTDLAHVQVPDSLPFLLASGASCSNTPTLLSQLGSHTTILLTISNKPYAKSPGNTRRLNGSCSCMEAI